MSTDEAAAQAPARERRPTGDAAGAPSHRERLLAGLAAAIRDHGYAGTTVAEIVAHARTSRRTFYEHFEDRDACLLELFDRVAEGVLDVITEAAAGEGPYLERLDATLAAYLDHVAADPELMRAMILELPAIGTAGVTRDRALTDRTARQLVVLVQEAADDEPSVLPLTMEAALVIVAGFRELIVFALEHGRAPRELHATVVELMRRITVREG